MILKGKLSSYGLCGNHFHMELNSSNDMLACEYDDDMLSDLKSPDPVKFRLQHLLGKEIEIEGALRGGRFKVTKARLP